MKLYKIVEGIGEGCGYACTISGMALIGSLAASAIGAKLPSRPIVEASIRVMRVATFGVIPVATIGSIASSFALTCMANQALEDCEKYRWKKMSETLQESNYCVASCQGCKHLVGRVAAGYLICAMHPYGWQGEDCPDRQEKEKF